MTIRNIPVLQNIVTNRNVGFETPARAFDHWHPGITAAASDDEATISILDPIGADFFGEGVTSKRIEGALRRIGQRDIVVNMNSPGGDFFEGVAIYNMLREHPKKVTVRILAMAGSAASVIAMAGDEIQIGRTAFIFIHNTQGVVVGDRHDMKDLHDALAIFDKSIIDVFAARSGMDDAKIGKMMDKETFISGQDAVESGFADEFLPSDIVTEDIENKVELDHQHALRRFDAIAAKAGVSRSERRALLREIRGTPGAAANGTPSAAFIREATQILRDIEIPTMKGALR